MKEIGVLTVQAVPACVRVSTPRSTDDLSPEDAIKMGNALIAAGDTVVMHPGGKAKVQFSSWKVDLTADEVLRVGRSLVEAGEALA